MSTLIPTYNEDLPGLPRTLKNQLLYETDLKVANLPYGANWTPGQKDELDRFKHLYRSYKDVPISYGQIFGYEKALKKFGLTKKQYRERYKKVLENVHGFTSIKLGPKMGLVPTDEEGKELYPEAKQIEHGSSLYNMPVELFDTYVNFSYGLGRGLGLVTRMGKYLPYIGESLDKAGISVYDLYDDALENRSRKYHMGEGVGGFFKALPSMGLETGLYMATAMTPIVGLGLVYGKGVDEVYEETQRHGISDDIALPLSAAGGGVYVLIEKLQMGRIIKTSKKGREILNKKVGKALVRQMSGGYIKKIPRRKIFKPLTKELLYNALTEGLEETAQEATVVLFGHAIPKKDASLKERIGILTSKESLKRYLLSGIAGAVMGTGFAGAKMAGPVTKVYKHRTKVNHLIDKMKAHSENPLTLYQGGKEKKSLTRDEMELGVQLFRVFNAKTEKSQEKERKKFTELVDEIEKKKGTEYTQKLAFGIREMLRENPDFFTKNEKILDFITKDNYRVGMEIAFRLTEDESLLMEAVQKIRVKEWVKENKGKTEDDYYNEKLRSLYQGGVVLDKDGLFQIDQGLVYQGYWKDKHLGAFDELDFREKLKETNLPPELHETFSKIASNPEVQIILSELALQTSKVINTTKGFNNAVSLLLNEINLERATSEITPEILLTSLIDPKSRGSFVSIPRTDAEVEQALDYVKRLGKSNNKVLLVFPDVKGVRAKLRKSKFKVSKTVPGFLVAYNFPVPNINVRKVTKEYEMTLPEWTDYIFKKLGMDIKRKTDPIKVINDFLDKGSSELGRLVKEKIGSSDGYIIIDYYRKVFGLKEVKVKSKKDHGGDAYSIFEDSKGDLYYSDTALAAGIFDRDHIKYHGINLDNTIIKQMHSLSDFNVGLLRHELEHLLDIERGYYVPVELRSRRDPSSIVLLRDRFENYIKEGYSVINAYTMAYKGHHKNYYDFDSMFLYRIMVREAIQEGADVPKRVLTQFDNVEGFDVQFLWHGPLYQGERGAVRFLKDGRADIHALTNPNLTTALHEMFHIWRRDLSPTKLVEIEKLLGVKDSKWTVAQEEKFANMGLEFAESGRTVNPLLRPILESFRDHIYALYKETTVRHPKRYFLSPEIKSFFDRSFGAGQMLKEKAKRWYHVSKYFNLGILRPANLVISKKNLGEDIYAQVITAFHTSEAEQQRFLVSTIGDKAVDDLRKEFSELSEEELLVLYTSRGEPTTDEGKALQREAQGFIEENPHLKHYVDVMQNIYDNIYDIGSKLFGKKLKYNKAYFYGVYREGAAEQFVNDFWKTSVKPLKKKKYKTFADAIGKGLVLKNMNPINNAMAELSTLTTRAAMLKLRENLMLQGNKKFIIKGNKDIVSEEYKKWVSVGFVLGGKGNKTSEPTFAGYLVDPDLGRMINNLLSTNKVTHSKILRTFRGINNFVRAIKFAIPLFHIMVVAQHAFIDTGPFSILDPRNWYKGYKSIFHSGPWDASQYLKTEDYIDYVKHGGGHKYSMEAEAMSMFKKFLTTKDIPNIFRALRLPLRAGLYLPQKFTEWTFDKYIPKMKYMKYLGERVRLEKKLSRPLSAQEKIEIIKEGQNFYGEMNERLFGRSGTATSLLRFLFLAPGFREGNFGTIGKALFEWDKKGHRSRGNIAFAVFLQGIIAAIGTYILTGKVPDFWDEDKKDKKDITAFRDAFRVKMGEKDEKGRDRYLDMGGTYRDYLELVLMPGIEFAGGKPGKASVTVFNQFARTLKNMRSPFAVAALELGQIITGKAVYDWKEDRVYYPHDPLLKKLLKITSHWTKNIEPIPISVYKQSREKGISDMMSFIYGAMGSRVGIGELEKRRNKLISKVISLRENQKDLYLHLGEEDYPRDVIDNYNRLVTGVTESPYLTNELKRDIKKRPLIIDVKEMLQNKSRRITDPDMEPRDVFRAIKYLKNFDMSLRDVQVLLFKYSRRVSLVKTARGYKYRRRWGKEALKRRRALLYYRWKKYENYRGR